MTEDERIAQLFSFVLERGFVFERDYNKATDSSCTQIYRFKKDSANYFEYRVLSARERNLFALVNGERKFPSPEKKYASFVRGWKLRRLFGEKDAWALAAALCRREIEVTGRAFGIDLGE